MKTRIDTLLRGAVQQGDVPGVTQVGRRTGRAASAGAGMSAQMGMGIEAGLACLPHDAEAALAAEAAKATLEGVGAKVTVK